MSGRGIFSRIAGQTCPVDEATAILEHVRAALNTRRDNSVCVPSLGVVDFTAAVLPGGADHLARSIRQTLLEHEPRLRSMSVRNVPADGEYFHVESCGTRSSCGCRSAAQPSWGVCVSLPHPTRILRQRDLVFEGGAET
jgi:hypothetical protein